MRLATTFFSGYNHPWWWIWVCAQIFYCRDCKTSSFISNDPFHSSALTRLAFYDEWMAGVPASFFFASRPAMLYYLFTTWTTCHAALNREFFGRKSDETCQQIVTNCSLRDVLLNCATERRAKQKKGKGMGEKRERERDCVKILIRYTWWLIYRK